MLEYIKGILVELTLYKAVVDVGGLGYSLLIPLSASHKMPRIGEEAFFYISTVIREDSHRNFAFLMREERDLFEKLSDVSGIGPKTALALIGHMESSDFETAITTANVSLLSRIPGIGKKTAERLVIELRDKIEKNSKKMPLPIKSHNVTEQDRVINDALSALMNLGYNSLQAQKAIKKALKHFDKEPELSLLITTALKGI